MRLGVISDVHGNLHALRATVDDLRAFGVDGWLSAGDVIGYGPHPNECVELLAELGAHTVAGNHELIVSGDLSDQRSSDQARFSFQWTRNVLRDDVLAYLRALPDRVHLEHILMTHGSLTDPEEYVSTPERAAHQLDLLQREHSEVRLLLLGHTHRQLGYVAGSGPMRVSHDRALRFDAAQPVLLNPGSVGQSRQWERAPTARAMVLDLERGEVWYRRIHYDVDACRDDLRSYGLPERSIHAPRRVRTVVRKSATRMWRRLQVH